MYVLRSRGRFDRVAGVNIVEDTENLRLVVAQSPQGHGHGAVDDLEHPTPGERLVLDQRDIRLNARGVAVHHEGDGTSWREHGDLAVAVAVLAAAIEAV